MEKQIIHWVELNEALIKKNIKGIKLVLEDGVKIPNNIRFKKHKKILNRVILDMLNEGENHIDIEQEHKNNFSISSTYF